MYSASKHELDNLRDVLRITFKFAESEEILDGAMKNAYERADLKHATRMLYADPDVAERGYDQDELDRILGEIRLHQADYPFYLPSRALQLQIIMGLRRGEVAALKWSDIHDGYIVIQRCECELKVPGEKTVYYIEEATKTKINRIIPLTPQCMEIINGLKEVHRRKGIKSDWLFPDERAELGIITLSVVYQHFRRICKKARVAVSGGKIRGTHAFRRNVATALRGAGVSAEMTSAALGHSVRVEDAHYYMGIQPGDPMLDAIRRGLEASGR